MPYKVDKKASETMEPVCVYRKDVELDQLICYGCFAKKSFGFGNKECHSHCEKNLPCICMDKIEVNDVLEIIKEKVEIIDEMEL